MRIILAFVVALVYSAPALAAGAAARAEATAVVVDVTDGATLMLESPVMGIQAMAGQAMASQAIPSQELRLAGIEAPQIARGDADGADGGESWPLAEDARQELAELALGHPVRLSFEGLPLDRYRRYIAHVHVERDHHHAWSPEPGIWLQGAMLARGMARVRSLADNRSRVAEMLAIEVDARAAARGIWAHPFYRIRSATEAGADIDSFQIVEGVVRDRARVRDRIYLNFGRDWRTDFTVAIDTRLLPIFEESGLDPMTLKSRRIRVRGWIEARNGPLIEATHPEQIEVLSEAAPALAQRP